MAQQQTILVTGATGAQGGGVARHLLQAGKHRVRCLTRNPSSEKAAALKSAGAEVVRGDLEDRDSLGKALEGCYGVFGVTNFWEHFGKEYQHGKSLVDAVKASGVQHFIFSSLPSAKRITKGAIEVPHFDMKADIEEYARQAGLPATFVHVAFYFENFVNFGILQKQEGGTLGFTMPQGDTPLAGVGVEDTGGVVSAIFDRRQEYLGKVVGIVGDDLPCSRYADILTGVLGVKTTYQHIPREVYANFGFPGAGELAAMYEFNRLHILSRKADVEESRKLYPGMQSFERWLEANKGMFAGLLSG